MFYVIISMAPVMVGLPLYMQRDILVVYVLCCIVYCCAVFCCPCFFSYTVRIKKKR